MKNSSGTNFRVSPEGVKHMDVLDKKCAKNGQIRLFRTTAWTQEVEQRRSSCRIERPKSDRLLGVAYYTRAVSVTDSAVFIKLSEPLPLSILATARLAVLSCSMQRSSTCTHIVL